MAEIFGVPKTSKHYKNLNCLCHQLLLSRLWINPPAILLDELNQFIGCRLHRNPLLDHFPAHVQINLARNSANVPEIGVRHLPGTIHDTAHDSNGNTWQMPGLLSNLRSHFLEVEQRPATRWARDEFCFGVTHAAALELAERDQTQLVQVGGGAPRVLQHHPFPHSIHEQGPDLAACLQHQLLLRDSFEGLGKDHRNADVIPPQVFEEATAYMGVAEVWAGAEEDEVRKASLQSADLLGGLGAIGGDRKALAALRQLRGPAPGLAHCHQGHGVGHRVGLQLLERNEDPEAGLLETPEHLQRSLVCGGLVEQHRIHRGDVLEGHAHRRLAPQRAVQRRLRRQLLRGDRGQHGPVAVQQRPVVEDVPLPLRGQVRLPPPEVAPLPVLPEIGHPLGLLHGVLPDPGQDLAGLDLQVRVLCQRHADGVPEPVQQQGPDPDGGLHSPVLALARLRDPQVQGVGPAFFVHAGGQQAVRLHHDQGVAGLH
mmetsp:Transcript_64883/g.107607  ORF Transcript_64883/g.107607 Transcript_64883/m.107607 type:complete len:483 (-) Transcript_64883:1252-2700(-)